MDEENEAANCLSASNVGKAAEGMRNGREGNRRKEIQEQTVSNTIEKTQTHKQKSAIQYKRTKSR